MNRNCLKSAFVRLGASVVLLGFIFPVQSQESIGPVPAVGLSDDGLPGIFRVGFLENTPWQLGSALQVDWGLIESMGEVPGTHYRWGAGLGAGLALWRGLAFGLQLNGRYDTHPADDLGSDSSAVLDPKAVLRGHFSLASGHRLGLSLSVWIPGEAGPSIVWSATTLTTAMLWSYERPDGRWRFSGTAGFRLDNSAQALPVEGNLRPGDRISLGLSEFHALTAGLAGVFQPSQWSVLAEVTSDIWLGSDAPTAASPIRFTLGGRWQPNPRLQFTGSAEVLLSGSRAEIGPEAPLVPVEPRFSIQLAAAYRFRLGGAKPLAAGPAVEPLPAASDDASATVAAAPTSAQKPASSGRVLGRLIDDEENPAVGVLVTVEIGDYTAQTHTDENGRYQFADLPLGRADFTAGGEAFETQTWSVVVGAGAPLESAPRQLTVVLPGSQLRGQVRSYQGKGIAATVRIEPLALTVTADEAGMFVVDLGPGDYQVEVTANGFRRQQHTITIEPHGVTILNIELRKKKKQRKR